MSTDTKHEFATVADTIRQQAGVWGLGVVGASNLGFCKGSGHGALSFKARLHFKGQTKARVMRVTISLNAADLYDIVVTRPDCTEFEFATDVYAGDLTSMLYALDAEGVEK